VSFDPADPLGPTFRAAVGAQIEVFLAAQRDLLAETGDRLDLVWRQARRLADGGKRMRPGFCYWGYVAVAEQPDPADPVLAVAASLDLLHASALIHDDVIDGSDTRRGRPSAHRFFARAHRRRGWLGQAEAFGFGAAIVLGDLLLAGSVAMAERSQVGSSRLKRARPYLDAARCEVAAGQYLDLVHQASGPAPADEQIGQATLVMEFKTSKYTVARPVQIGAALGLAKRDTLAALGRFGSHLGHAYQMRDDLLGVFGDPAVTGKPAGDDLREGKRTVLVAHALSLAEPSQAAWLEELLSRPDLEPEDLRRAKRLLRDCGAVKRTERAIEVEAARALRYVSQLDVSAPGLTALTALTHAVVEREA
jgi:geranylgeranyl diphosphate synthase type I